MSTPSMDERTRDDGRCWMFKFIELKLVAFVVIHCCIQLVVRCTCPNYTNIFELITQLNSSFAHTAIFPKNISFFFCRFFSLFSEKLSLMLRLHLNSCMCEEYCLWLAMWNQLKTTTTTHWNRLLSRPSSSSPVFFLPISFVPLSTKNTNKTIKCNGVLAPTKKERDEFI